MHGGCRLSTTHVFTRGFKQKPAATRVFNSLANGNNLASLPQRVFYYGPMIDERIRKCALPCLETAV